MVKASESVPAQSDCNLHNTQSASNINWQTQPPISMFEETNFGVMGVHRHILWLSVTLDHRPINLSVPFFA